MFLGAISTQPIASDFSSSHLNGDIIVALCILFGLPSERESESNPAVVTDLLETQNLTLGTTKDAASSDIPIDSRN
jgi:hypothetical protein